MRLMTISTLVSSIAVVASGAAAQSETGLYGRLQAGGTFLNDFEQNLTPDPTVVFVAPPPDFQAVETDLGVTVGAALGFTYQSGFRTELEYRYASASIDTVQLLGLATGLSVDIDDDNANAHFVMSNVYYDFKNTSFITPYVGVGVGGAWVSLYDGLGSDSAFAYQGRAGVNLDMGPQTSLGVEYLYTRTRDLEFEGEALAIGPNAVVDDAPYAASSILVSLTRRF